MFCLQQFCLHFLCAHDEIVAIPLYCLEAVTHSVGIIYRLTQSSSVSFATAVAMTSSRAPVVQLNLLTHTLYSMGAVYQELQLSLAHPLPIYCTLLLRKHSQFSPSSQYCSQTIMLSSWQSAYCVSRCI